MKSVTSLLFMLLLMATILSGLDIQSSEDWWYGTIYIRADGSVDPPDAPVVRDGNVYTLTANIKSDYHGIVVQRSDIILDGAGHIIEGSGEWQYGVYLDGVKGVTIRNTIIRNFYDGIHLWWASGNIIIENILENNYVGIYLHSSSNNIISENNIANNNGSGIYLHESSSNQITGNKFTNCGITVWASYNNIVEDNTVNGKPLVYLEGVSDYTVSDAGQVILINCSTIRVENLDLSNTDVAVLLWHTNNSLISKNNIENNRGGIYLYQSSNNVILSNHIENNSWSGIEIWGSSDNSIVRNNIADNIYGIALLGSSDNTISYNYIENNSWSGIYFYSSSNNQIIGNKFTNSGLVVLDSYNNIVEDNTVNGKPLVYLEGISGYTVTNAGQVILINCSNIRVENLDLSDTTVGVELWNTNNSVIARNIIENNLVGIYLFGVANNLILGNQIENNNYSIVILDSSNNRIIGNNIANNYEGINLQHSSNNIISGNVIVNNNEFGIYLYYSSNNSVVRNNIANNKVGIHFYSSSNNFIYHNNIVNNIQQVYCEDSTNVWDNDYPSGGNYWSDYDGEDNYSGPNQDQPGSDGIGDTPYVIDENNVDRYPFMDPYGDTTLTAEFNPTIISLGEASNLTITTGTLPEGLSGYEITVYIDDPTTAKIEEIILPSWATLYEIVNQTDSKVTVKVVDINDQIRPGSTNVKLLTLRILGTSQGTTGVSIEVHKMDDDKGNPIEIFAIYSNNLVVDPTMLGITAENTNIIVDSIAKVIIYADHLPKGLSRYTLNIGLNSTVARIVKVEFPSWASLHYNSTLPACTITISAVDLNNSVRPGATNVVFATIYIEGVTQGEFKIELLGYSVDDDKGDAVPIVLDESFNTKFIVTLLQPLPGCSNPPRDLDNDGLYEDVNGNGRLDFDDVVKLFKNMDWVINNNYEKYFDFNRNGRLDFNDIVLLFKMI